MNDLLGATGTVLTAISLIPGIGTVVGVGGLVVLAAGSFIVGALNTSQVGADTVLLNWGDANACN